MGQFAKLFGGRSRSDSRGGSPPSSVSTPQDSSQLDGFSLNGKRSDNVSSGPLYGRSNGSSVSVASPAPPSSASQRRNSTRGGDPHLRFELYDDGTHLHRLRNTLRQEKLGRMLRDIMGNGKKVGDDAISAVPDFVQLPKSKELSLMSGLVSQVANGEVEVGMVNGATNGKDSKRARYTGDMGDNPVNIKEQSKCLLEKYGRPQELVGKGSYGTVRVSHKLDEFGKEKLYAVKEFRKRSSEQESTFQDRLMSEFCISSQLRHPNIIHTFDLMKDAHGGFCQIMEYCPGGDLYSLILSAGSGLKKEEADCFFKQLMRGVAHTHSMGVAHCDLKPENILLTANGTIKISDFGNGECFRMAWENEIHLCNGVTGSGPYIAPEEFKSKPFDPRAVDIWATGIIYMVMRTGSYLWRKTVPEEDENYAKYVTDRKTSQGYAPIERFAPSKCVYVIYSILDPVPGRRITAKQVLNSEWSRGIKLCDAAESRNGYSDSETPRYTPSSASSIHEAPQPEPMPAS